MTYFRYAALLLLILIIAVGIGQTQGQDFQIDYGETQSAFFEDNVFTHRWLVVGADLARDIPVIKTYRIAGQFTPRLRILDGANNVLAESSGTAFSDYDELTFTDGLPELQVYQIEVTAININSNQSDNPAEYSISLSSAGKRRASIDEGINPLPSLGLEEVPNLREGNSQRLNIGVDVFGSEVTVERSPTPNIPSRFLVSDGQRSIQVNQSIPIGGGVRNLTFLENGLGVVVLNANFANERYFFSDEEFLLAYNDVSREYTFTLSSGTVIITDFYRIDSIEVREGVIALRMRLGDTVKRLLFNNSRINARRLSAGENEIALNQIELENGQFITTDLQNWDTLAYLDGQLQVFYGNDARFFSDTVRYFLRRDATNPSLSNINLTIPVAGSDTPRRLTITTDWLGLGDVRINEGMLYYEPLNGIRAEESVDEVNNILFENGAVQFSRRDNTVRSVFPDGTEVNSPAQLPDNTEALPNEPNFRARNFNDLGENPLPLCPCLGNLQETLPINPVNGNFFYKVSDFYIPSSILPLEFTRYYNSQDAGTTPRYMNISPTPYVRMGTGWRHSFQHELDISGAPLGRIRYIEPDGTQHYFTPVAGNANRWTSRTLLAMVIIREGGTLGTWQGIRTDGLRLYFDRVGRLNRLSLAEDRSITLSPLPLTYTSDSETGLFVVEPYGRRLELYVGESGRVETVRDTFARSIRFTYENNLLTDVEYITPTQTATYQYNGLGLLERFDDVRSPYTQVGFIEYDARSRAEHYLENPDDISLQRDYRYSYEQTAEGRITRRSFTVSGETRNQAWAYNTLHQMTNITLPSTGGSYEFAYDPTTGVLASVRTPSLVRFGFTFDSRGNLTRYEDPFSPQAPYNFTYEQRGERSLLTRISYPNGRVDDFRWSAGEEARLIAHETLVFVGVSRDTRTTRYEYDDWGRLVMLTDPANVANIYNYDSFGYVSSIWRGITLEDGESRESFADSSRALSVMQFNYDLIGQLRAITDGRGASYTLNWDSSTEQLRQINGANDVFLIYNYDERGRVILVNDRGQETVYTYNGLDLVSSITDAQGALVTYEYDEVGNLVRQVDDLQRETSYRYDALDNLVEWRSSSGIRYIYETLPFSLETNFTVRREADPIGRIIERAYDAVGRLRLYSITEPDIGFSQQFAYTYDVLGNPLRIEETTTGRAIVFEYNLVGEVRAIDVAGSRTTFSYDSRGYLNQVTSPAGRVTRYAYDELGNVQTVTLPDGSSWQYTYDENSNLLSATDPTGIISNYVYNALNQVVSQEDELGNLQGYAYDLRGNLNNIIDPLGISRSFSYDALDNLVSAVDGRGLETSYQYDAVGRLVNITQPGVRSTRLTYDSEDNIIAITERPREQRTLYSYDALGRITSITDPLGHTTSYRYSPIGRIEQMIDPLGNSESYTWRAGTQFLETYTSPARRNYTINTDPLGRVTAIRDASTIDIEPINTQFFYDADGYVTGIQTGTDANRQSGTNDLFYQYSYSPNGYPTSYTDPTGGVWALNYDSVGRLLAMTNPNGVTTRYIYDETGRITQIIHQAGTEAEAIESYEYNANGNLIAYVSPIGVRNEYVYNQNNLLATATLAVGTEQQARYVFEYNTLGQLLFIRDPFGRETRYYYSLDELIRIERDYGEEQVATTYDFDDGGNLRRVTLPERIEDVNLTYDALNRPVRYVNGENNTWSYTYDAAGNIAQISDPLGSAVAYSYDSYNRVTRIQYPSGSAVTLSYDTAGNLRTVTLPPNLNGTSQSITYRLDILGNIVEMQIAGSITRFEYDAMGNVTARINPDNRRTTYTYDAAGRLAETRYPDGTVITNRYDAAGQLLSSGENSYEYDVYGNLRLAENANSRIRYTYDTVGNLLERDAGDLGLTRYVYDELDRLENIEFNGNQIQIIYDARNQVRQILRSNGVQTAINYDAASRPISIVHISGNERLDGFNYQYDAVGNLTRVDRIVDQWRIIYSYDVDHRLIGERWLNEIGETVYTVNFSYDRAGNRTEEVRNGRSTSFNYDEQNRLVGEVRNIAPQGNEFLYLPSFGLSIGAIVLVARRRKLWWLIPSFVLLWGVGAAFAQTVPQINVRYEYDANGNLSRIIYARSDANYELRLSYDAENRLVAVTGQDENGSAVDTALSYDQFSRLVNWRSGERDYSLFYDGHELIGMSDGETLDTFLSFNGQRLLTLTGEGEALWHLNDQLGSTRRYADADGALLQDPSRFLEFASFGLRIFPYYDGRIAPEGAQISELSPFFGGNLYDPSTRLYLMGLRAYDPLTGRFLQADPIRQDPVGTLYTYARNRPFVFGDRNGLYVEPFIEPLRAASIDEQIEPERLIPRPSLPDFPIPPAVHRQQADETFRALQLLDSSRNGTNDVIAMLSPLHNDFYMMGVNPIPDEIRSLANQPLERMMQIYQVGDAWLPDPRPNPTIAQNPFDLFGDAQILLAQAYINPLAWCFDDANYYQSLLPQVNEPQGLNQRWQIESSLRQDLQALSLMSALVPQSEGLFNLDNPSIAPSFPEPVIVLPSADIEPAILNSLDALREESFDFVSRIWTIGAPDCEDCVPNLGFGR